MASKQININISGKNSAGSAIKGAAKDVSALGKTASYTMEGINKDGTKVSHTFEAIGKSSKKAGKDIGTLKKESATAGSVIGQSISRGATIASNSLNKLKTAGTNAFSAVKKGAGDASASLDGMNGAIGSVVAGFGAMELVQAAWSGSTSRQFNQAYLATKVGQKSAAEYMKTIQDIVVQVPGDDTFMNQLLSGAVARQTNLGNAELSMLGRTAADYMVVSQNMGKSMIETQMDLKEYIQTGNTSQMERDSILKNQLGTLKGQETVEDRIKALQKAMNDEGYAGLSNLDIASIKWEEIKGRVALAATNVGEKLLPYVEKVLDFIIELDERTNGFSTTVGFVGAAFIAMGIPAAYVAKKMFEGYKWAARMTSELVKSAAASKGVSSPGGTAGTAGAGMGTAAGVGASILAIGSAAALAGGSMKIFNDAIKGTHESLMRMIGNLPSGTGSMGLIGASLLGEKFSVVDQLRALFPPLNMIMTSYENIRNIGTFAYSALSSGAASAAAGANSAWQYIRGGAISAFGSISSAWSGLKNRISKGAHGVVSLAMSGFGAVRSGLSGILGQLRSIASRTWTAVVNTVTGKGPAGIGAARGPYDGMNLNYENYAGMQKSPFTSNGMSGNCVDMSLGMMAMNGGRGKLVNGTWNGGPHVWYQDQRGRNWDPARKALSGTWNPPARGPGDNMGAVVINGDVYGFDDFQKKVEQATNRIVMGAL